MAITLATDFPEAECVREIYIYIYMHVAALGGVPQGWLEPNVHEAPLTRCLSFPHWRGKHQGVKNYSGE